MTPKTSEMAVETVATSIVFQVQVRKSVSLSRST